MKLVSFNVNSVRTRLHQLEKLIDKHSPDVIGLQETKVRDEEFPVEEINSLGYHVEFFGQKTHYGVAMMSKSKPDFVQKGFPSDDADAQRRLIACRFGDMTVVNGYFPQGENREHEVKFPAKRKFYEDLQTYVETSFTPEDKVVVMGDMNIAPTDYDIGIGEQNAKRWLKQGKTSFLPEEREWIERLYGWGFVDSYRMLKPECNQYFSWFDYRSKGFQAEPKRGLRIDLILVTEPLAKSCKDSFIDYEIRDMERPSDHAPVILEMV
jgi:exodeoxyribonuclease-3